MSLANKLILKQAEAIVGSGGVLGQSNCAGVSPCRPSDRLPHRKIDHWCLEGCLIGTIGN